MICAIPCHLFMPTIFTTVCSVLARGRHTWGDDLVLRHSILPHRFLDELYERPLFTEELQQIDQARAIVAPLHDTRAGVEKGPFGSADRFVQGVARASQAQMVQCGIAVQPDAAACILAGECKDREHGQRCLSGVQSPKRMVDEYVEDIQLKKVLGAGFRV